MDKPEKTFPPRVYRKSWSGWGDFLGISPCCKPKTITLPADVLCCYIEMNGRTYYLDDSTGEQIMEEWEEGQPCD